ncbi:hypothetical protein FGADI_9454 [Fusarium gaditjirri]|uniref:Uncharacterized protein n=1 Tax=Fusarium gaditjirri TaxID=282569 RepID=A0A8H4WSV4_9HYPO|nr:hypothetical protein FGADI_9454 [Fusarium gaditjirri]
MSKELQDQHSMKEETMEIQLDPRAATQAVTRPEARNETAKPDPSQADTDNDRAFAIDSSEQAGAASDHESRLTNQSAQSSIIESCLQRSLRQETEADVGAQSHSSQEALDNSVHLRYRDDQILLSAIREVLLSKLSTIREESGGQIEEIKRLGMTHSKDYGMVGTTEQRTRRNPSERIQEGPKGGLCKFRKGVQCFPISLLACALSLEEPFGLPRGRSELLDVGYSASFLSTDFRGGYSISSGHPSHTIMHWQIRYFSPLRRSNYDDRKCLLSKRQTVTIRQGSKEICMQEKRARVSYRVLKEAREIFSILVLTDEDTRPDTYKTGEVLDFERLWGRDRIYGKDTNGWPIAHYIYEICRVFKICMDAWGEALDTIDELVNIKLNDLDNLHRVEKLMFDNSFERSKDYFIALQLLRIINEWLDEVQSTVEDMVKNMPGFRDVGHGFLQIAIDSVKENASIVQDRVKNKQEEINSLRDGLFNATSLRESTKAMALNQAIYVFTVVTVLFTPVSFLATFWALPFLNNPVEGTGIVPVPSAFRNSFIIMPLLTYALVIGVAWFVGQRNSVDRVLSILREFGERTGKLLKSGWNLLPKKSKKDDRTSSYA